MKTISLPVFLTLFSVTAFAQVKVKIAPEAGFNIAMQSQRTKSPTTGTIDIQTSHIAPSASGGVMVDLKILRNFYIQTGPSYFFNNIKYVRDVDLTSVGLDVPQRTQYDRLHTLRLPLYAMYKSGYEGMGRFIAGIGPYVSYAFAGNRVIKMPVTSFDPSTGKTIYSMETSNTELNFGNEAYKDDYRNWDYGANACIGYEANVGLYFRGSFHYSFTNSDPAGTDNYRVKNWGFGISIGYLIGKDTW